MDYALFLKTVNDLPEQPLSDKVWRRIAGSIAEQKQQKFSLLWQIFPRVTLIGATLAVILIMSLGYMQKATLSSYFQVYSSTEYIYEACKYPG